MWTRRGAYRLQEKRGKKMIKPYKNNLPQLAEADLAAIRESAEEYLRLAEEYQKKYQREYQPMEEFEKK